MPTSPSRRPNPYPRPRRVPNRVVNFSRRSDAFSRNLTRAAKRPTGHPPCPKRGAPPYARTLPASYPNPRLPARSRRPPPRYSEHNLVMRSCTARIAIRCTAGCRRIVIKRARVVR